MPLKVKITKLEFDWNHPAGDAAPPEYELYQFIGKEYTIPQEYENEIEEYIEEEILDTNFPVVALEWEVIDQ